MLRQSKVTCLSMFLERIIIVELPGSVQQVENVGLINPELQKRQVVGCSDLEMIFINCRPFYLLREICSFILVSIYIPPQAHVSSALQNLADLITDTEQQYPYSV